MPFVFISIPCVHPQLQWFDIVTNLPGGGTPHPEIDAHKLVSSYIQPLQEVTVPISQELLDMLVCPVCKTPVKLTDDEQGLRCPACRIVYPIRDGFPVMLKDEARPES
jgi:uncharacterized protein YbaR (Trm112 family)